MFRRGRVVSAVFDRGLLCFRIQLSKRYGGHSNGSGSIDELRQAFESAERCSPGISDVWVRDLLARLLPNQTEARIRTIVDRVHR